EFGNLNLFLDVHEEVYRYLAEANSYKDIEWRAWRDRVPHVDEETAELSYQEVRQIGFLWYEHLDEVAALLESEQIETEIFFMDHAKRLRFEARLAALQEYRRRLHDPS